MSEDLYTCENTDGVYTLNTTPIPADIQFFVTPEGQTEQVEYLKISSDGEFYVKGKKLLRILMCIMDLLIF